MLSHARPYKWLAGQSFMTTEIVHFAHVLTMCLPSSTADYQPSPRPNSPMLGLRGGDKPKRFDLTF